MSRRLEQATEDALLSGDASGRRAIQDAGFSEELKAKLIERVAAAESQHQHASHSTAGETPWTGTENTVDAVLRMLQDAKKPMRAEAGARCLQPPVVVDTRLRRRRPPQSPGQRAVNARDKASMYVGMDMKTLKGLSVSERNEMKAELRERFEPVARAVPATISGIAALANQRIEDAIARGQFKHLPRGQEMPRDPRADSPFIDTTEFIMNRMIRRQELVPPWIEKQQELTKAVRVFRERLRNDWKRHVARTIASWGGSLKEQMGRAAAFATAEVAYNPRYSGTDSSGSTGEEIRRKDCSCTGLDTAHRTIETGAGAGAGAASAATITTITTTTTTTTTTTAATATLLQRPYRDHEWEKTEKAYMELSIENLNRITRSYNIMAPELARKPYFSLDRELNACFADVAPLIAQEIKTRAVDRRTSTAGTGGVGDSAASTLVERFVGTDRVKVHLEAGEKAYGLKEWWRDIWRRD
ncbi:hypothetical protein E4U17_002195 [Claviceps sp. LM77 group G4]|nr:hypothetical protein E4U17_002195 [Claviceps sp. LM77 group G4]KAG6075538.1 hypothetical protein E4U33_002054 [Claviceps sp. LM78 group G4]KAG6076708.1 hypothetical protein E4U16_002635 [Claviceps sp. LM84 group G4]